MSEDLKFKQSFPDKKKSLKLREVPLNSLLFWINDKKTVRKNRFTLCRFFSYWNCQ